MAYAAVTSLIQTLEYLVKFPCVVFEIQAKAYNKEVDQLLDKAFLKEADHLLEALEKEEAVNEVEERIYQLIEHRKQEKDVNSLQLATERFINQIRRREISEPLVVGSFFSRTSDMEEFKEKILEEINSSQKKLLYSQPTTKQHLASVKLKDDITVFCEVATETTLVCQELQHLLTFLDSPSTTNGHDHTVEHIRDVADEARNFVDICMVDNQIEHAYAHFESHPDEFEILGQSLVNRVKSIFLENGIHECLLLTLKKVRSIREEIKALTLEDLQLGSTSLDASSHGNSNQEDIVVGLDDDICTIIEKLTRPPPFRLEILTVVSMGGIGKTTLARKVFDHKSIVLHFRYRAWVTVSQVYEAKDLLFSLLCSVSQPTYEKHGKSKEDIGEELYRKLKGRTYLIVIDDLWSIEAWNAVQGYFPDDRNGSRVILTSRSIITEFKPEERPYHFLRLLDRDRSWELLEKVVFGRKSCPPELVDVGKQIASQCGGLPLAIVVIAGLLSRIRGTLECWQDIADSVRSYVCGDPKKCLDILAFSYNILPNRLKACWLYLGAFPEDLRDLIGRNLILVGKRNFNGKVKTCRLHDFLRELCLREAEKEKFMYVLPRGAQGFRRGIGDMHRLSIHMDSISDVPSFPDAVSLMCFSLGYNFSPDILLFELQLKVLRVLDIYFLHFDHFPFQILEMVHLRYIALNVTYDLPASMSQLRNLQTILIRGPWGCPILSLEYWSMPFLRHLLTSVVCRLNYPTIGRKDLARPFAPEYLLSLSTISFSSCTREVFSIMPELKKLCICETEKTTVWVFHPNA